MLAKAARSDLPATACFGGVMDAFSLVTQCRLARLYRGTGPASGLVAPFAYFMLMRWGNSGGCPPQKLGVIGLTPALKVLIITGNMERPSWAFARLWG